MRRIVLVPALAAALLFGLPAAPASAQTDIRALYDRIERLDRDVSGLQQQLNRGGTGGSTVIRSPALGGGSTAAPASPPIPSGMASRFDERLDQLEDQLRQITGKVEEANHKAATVAKQLERMQADLDLRFKDLQAAQAQPQLQAQAPQPLGVQPGATTPQGAPVLIPPKGVVLGGNGAEGNGPAPGPQTLGTMPEKDLKRLTPQNQPAEKPGEKPGEKPAEKPKDAQGTYDEAYGLMQKSDYAGAEQRFQAFLQQYPAHTHAGNAQFWLGEIAFVRQDFAESARLYAEAYKKYPKHGKAPDMLYKLGASFAKLGKNKEACTAYGLLSSEHPDMPDRIKRAVAADRGKLACKS